MKPGILIIVGDRTKYGSGHETRMRLLAIELKKRKIDVQLVRLAPDEPVAVPLPFSLVLLDRRDTPFNPPLPESPVQKMAIDNRGAGRAEADVVSDLLPHVDMNKAEYSAALRSVILSPEITGKPGKGQEAKLTLHNTAEEAFAASDFIPGKERLSPRAFLTGLSAAKRPALYFGQALFEAIYLGLDVQLYPVSEYHKKLAVDLFSRQLIEPDLFSALDGQGLGRFTDLVQKTWKQAESHA